LSEEIIDEYAEVLARPKFAFPQDEIEALCSGATVSCFRPSSHRRPPHASFSLPDGEGRPETSTLVSTTARITLPRAPRRSSYFRGGVRVDLGINLAKRYRFQATPLGARPCFL